MSVRVRVTVAVYRTDRSLSIEQVEFRDTVSFAEWDVRGLGRILRRVKRALDAEHRLAAREAVTAP